MNQEKTSWPELEGKNVDEAAEIIKYENPELNVQKVPEGSFITYDYRIDRVRLFYNTETNVVAVTPNCG